MVGEVASGAEALKCIPDLKPNLVCLDVFLIKEEAADVVRAILGLSPLPIILVSDAPRNAAEVFDALAAGALELVPKPARGDVAAVATFLETIRMLSNIKLHPKREPQTDPHTQSQIVTIAASTGGPAALRSFLSVLPINFKPPVIVAQHLAPGFEDDFAKWLSQGIQLKARVAVDGEQLKEGEVLIGRSGCDLYVLNKNRINQRKAPKLGYHPSADVLFSSAASAFGNGVTAVILSGIGSDGTEGARAVSAANGTVMAQDAASSVVYGMPGAVTNAGLARITGSPKYLAQVIVNSVMFERT